jgi:RNA polymerase sigma-70 factor (ECF subfamily)
MVTPATIQLRGTNRLQVIVCREKDSFYELVHSCEHGLFATAFSILGNQADAEEVVQEAVLKAFRARSKFRGDCKFSTWLIQITINEAKMRLRKDHRHMFESLDSGQRSCDGDYVPRDFADWRAIPSEALENRELQEVLAKGLNDLPLKYRLVMLLRDVEQLSIDETAKVLEISAASVKTRLLRARLRMRDALALSSYAKHRKAC